MLKMLPASWALNIFWEGGLDLSKQACNRGPENWNQMRARKK